MFTDHEQVIERRVGRAAARHDGYSAAAVRLAVNQQPPRSVGATPEGDDGNEQRKSVGLGQEEQTQHGGTGGLFCRHLRFLAFRQPAVPAFVVPVQERQLGHHRRHPRLALARPIPLGSITASSRSSRITITTRNCFFFFFLILNSHKNNLLTLSFFHWVLQVGIYSLLFFLETKSIDIYIYIDLFFGCGDDIPRLLVMYMIKIP